MSEQPDSQVTSAPTNVASSASSRLDKLIQLLEEDRLGYRTERFITATREALVQELQHESAFVTKTPQDFVDKIVHYDKVVLPYVTFVAVGAVYSPHDYATLWSTFLEGVAKGSDSSAERFSYTSESVSVYPAVVLLYASGVLAASRRRWSCISSMLYSSVKHRSNIEQPLVLNTGQADILPEAALKLIPGQERTYAPLASHLHDVLKPVLTTYFTEEASYTAAFSYFEVILSMTYAYADSQDELFKDGKIPEKVWVPWGRCFHRGYDKHHFIEQALREVRKEKEAWPPLAAGLFGSSVELSVDLLTKVNTFMSSSSRFGFR